MKKFVFLLGTLLAFGLIAQDKQAMKFAKTITTEDLKSHLSVLASDEYEGRETGKKGAKMAAKYISEHFKTLGFEGPVDGGYFQTFDLTEATLSSSYFKKGDEKKEVFEDFIYYSSSETMGEEYVSLVMIGESDSLADSYEGQYMVFVVDHLGLLQGKLDQAKDLGAEGYVIVLKGAEEFSGAMARFTPFLKKPTLSLGEKDSKSDKLIVGDASLLSWIYGKDMAEIEEGEKAEIIFNADYLNKPLTTENVLGFLKGTEKPDEVLIITAHYDHIGIAEDGDVNNGADDDGSGTVSVLEIAEAFSKAAAKKKGPKRSILFMTVTGEEKGLLGSQYYTDYDPVFPLENTVASLNIDMVGRVDDDHLEKPNYIYLIGSDKLSQELHDLSEEANKTYTQLELNYTYNDENDPNRFYYRSDHYNFAKNNIPIIFYFNGTHPDYHLPTDEVDKIAFDVMEKRARLVFHTAWEIANREKRIEVDKK